MPNPTGLGRRSRRPKGDAKRSAEGERADTADQRSDSDHKSTKTSTIALWITSITSLVVAGIGFVSADHAAEKSGDKAIDMVRQQLSGDSENARTEFLRTERKILYAKIVIDEQVTDVKSYDFFTEKRSECDPKCDLPPKKYIGDTYSKAYTQFEVDGRQVKILGSSEVLETYTELLKAHERMRLRLLDTRANRGYITYERYTADKELIKAARGRFLDAGRRDVTDE